MHKVVKFLEVKSVTNAQILDSPNTHCGTGDFENFNYLIVHINLAVSSNDLRFCIGTKFELKHNKNKQISVTNVIGKVAMISSF